MAAVQRIRPWLFLAAAALLVLALALLAYQHFRPADPCAELDRAALFSRYPALKALGERQEEEVARLLARHRAQDISINLELGGERITPEEALRLSLNQVNEVSALRREHNEAFRRACRGLVGRQ